MGGSTVDILQLLDELEDEITTAQRMPIGGRVVVDRRRLLDIIERLRVAIPSNIKQARSIMERREQAEADAEAAAERIIADAEREAEARVSQSALVRAAQERGHQLELEAEERARRILANAQAEAERLLGESEARARAQEAEADRFALALFTNIEQQLEHYLARTREAKAQLE